MPYALFIDTVCDGVVPILHDGDGRVIVFSEKVEAEKEAAQHAIDTYQQVIDGDVVVFVEEWVAEIAVNGFGRLVEYDEPYVFDRASSDAVKSITDKLPCVSCWEDHADIDTPYDVHELCGIDGKYVNIITRYAPACGDDPDVVGWAIEQHDADGPDTDEVEVLDSSLVLQFVAWILGGVR